MTDSNPPTNSGGRRNPGQLQTGFTVLGAGIGAAIGAVTDNLGSGIWIGGAIGVGLGMLAGYFLNR